MKIVTSDGQEFTSVKEARAHERSLKPAGASSRSLDCLPHEMVAAAFENLDSDLARQLITLGSQLRAKRAAAGLTRTRAKAA